MFEYVFDTSLDYNVDYIVYDWMPSNVKRKYKLIYKKNSYDGV